MKLILQKGPRAEASTLVMFLAKDKGAPKPASTKFTVELKSLLDAAISDARFTGAKQESVFFRHCAVAGFTNVLFVGLGETEKLDSEAVRVAGATVYAALKGHKVTAAALSGESLFKAIKDSSVAIQALAEGLLLSDYAYDELKTKAKTPAEKFVSAVTLLTPLAPSQAQQKALKRAEILSECQNFTRWLGDTPGNLMTPTILAEETAKAAKGTGLKVTIWDKARIKKENFGGLLSVSLGSDQEPRFIIMEYKGAGAGKRPVCFVGKGLTFDSGGISIKPSAAMEEMKYDMCGGAAVIGTLLALAKLKAKVNVIGLVPASENMPGPSALKPGDVYKARNGKSVEVFNTDAEGRLILGDALAYGSEQKPVAMFDAATLTGAILVALGNTHTGVFTRDVKLRKRIQEAGETTGELVWAMPLNDFHREDMKGTHADLCNISAGRLAGSSTAAAFLEEFVSEGIPWAHFDIAGTAWNVSSRFPYCPKKSASGVIVRTFVELAESY